MTTIVQHLHTAVADEAPTATGLLVGQIAMNVNGGDRLLFIGDGSDVYTRLDGTTEPAPVGRGFFAGKLCTEEATPPPNQTDTNAPTVTLLSPISDEPYAPALENQDTNAPTVTLLSPISDEPYAPALENQDTNAPTVEVLNAPLAGANEGESYTFSIQVSDADSSLDAGTLIAASLIVERGDGTQLAKTVTVRSNTGSTAILDVSLTPGTKNESYIIKTSANSFADQTGNVAPAQTLGDFYVGPPKIAEFTLENLTSRAVSMDVTADDYEIKWGDGTTSNKSNYAPHAYSGQTEATVSVYANGEAISISAPNNKEITGFLFEPVVGNLTQLSLNNTSVSGDIAGLSGLTELTQLRLNNTSVSGDIAGLSGLTELTQLRLNNTSVSGDIAGLSGLTELTHLYLANTSVSGDIADLSGLTRLTQLYLNSTAVAGDIADLSGLTRLTHLYLYSTAVAGDIADLSGLTGLTQLHLANTSGAGDIAGLSGLTRLTQLYLNSTSVLGDIADLSGLTRLTHLYLYSTSVAGDIASPMDKLRELQLRSTEIANTDLDSTLLFLRDRFQGGHMTNALTLDVSGTRPSDGTQLQLSGTYADPTNGGSGGLGAAWEIVNEYGGEVARN